MQRVKSKLTIIRQLKLILEYLSPLSDHEHLFLPLLSSNCGISASSLLDHIQALVSTWIDMKINVSTDPVLK